MATRMPIDQFAQVIYGTDPATGLIVPYPVNASGTIPTAPGGAASIQLVDLIAFGAAINVSVLTPLFALQAVPGNLSYISLLFAVTAVDSTQPIIVTLDASSDGVHVEAPNEQTFTVPAGGANSLEITPWPSRPYWALSAQSQNGSVQPVKFAWKAVPR